MFLKDKKAMNFGKVLNQRGFVSLVATLVMLLLGMSFYDNIEVYGKDVFFTATDVTTEKDEAVMGSLNETCQEYFDRRISEGWEVIEYNWPHAILLSPDGIRREIDLRNDVETLRPNGDVTVLFTPVPSTDNAYERVNEVICDGDTGYVEDTWCDNGSFKITVGDLEGGDVESITTSYATYSYQWNQNPTTALPWVHADIVALEIGYYAPACGGIANFAVSDPSFGEEATVNSVKVYVCAKGIDRGGGEFDHRLSQVYAEVDYTSIVAPTVTTQAVSSVGTTTAIGNGNVTDDGGAEVTERGVCYNIGGNPTTADSKAQAASGGIGVFTASMTGLSQGQKYYVKAYAINSEGTSYGEQVDFTTTFQYAFSGTLTSTNLLDGETVSGIDIFFASTTQPAATALWAQFSQDSSDWYSAGGVLGATTTIATSTPTTDLSGLKWSGPNFYYKMFFSSDGTDTPILDEISVDFTSWIPRPPGISPSGGGVMMF